MSKKHLTLSALAVVWIPLLSPQGQASGIYSTYLLNASGSSGEVFNGVDGWSQSEANYSANYPRAYIQPFSGGVTGFAVGGFYDTEPFTGGDTLTISRTLVGNLARGATLNATFQMQDSSVLNDPNEAALGYFDVDRNQFSIGLGDFVSLVLQPASQSSDPENETALWNPFLSVGGQLRPITGAQVQEGGSYTFSVTLNSSAGGLNYSASLTDFGGTAILSSGSIPGASAADLLTSVDVGWSLAGTEVDGLGSNSIAISSLSLRTAQEQAGTLFSTYSLNATGSSGEVFNGVDGWAQSEANFSANYPRAYVQPFSGGVTGFAVGGFYDTEPFAGGDTLTISHTLVGNLARGATLSATFQMQDSSVLNDPNDAASGYFDVDRNQFSIGLGDFVSLVLQPVAQSSDPENDNALWNPFLSVGGELRPITGAQVQEGGSYTFSVTLSSSAGGLNYSASLTDFGGTAILSSGSIPGSSATDLLTSVDVGWSLAGTEVDGLGSNSIAVSSLSLRAAQELAGSLYTLNATGSSGEVLNGVDGWSQSEANYSENYPRAYIQPFSGEVTGFAVGGFYDTEPFTGGDSLTVSQSIAGRLASGATLNATFQMQDSSVLIDPNDAASGYFDVDRNQFSIGLGGLVSLVLQPAAQSSDPDNDTALWNPFISVGGELIPITGAQVQEGGSYTFSVTLSSSAGGLDYSASLTDLGGTEILSSGSIPGSSATDLLTTADVGWSLAGTEVDGLGSNSIAISAFSVSISAGWESLQPRIYSGTAVDLLPDQPEDVVRYQLPATVETPASFSNIPSELDLSYLSVAPGSQRVSAMGNLVEGDSGAETYVHAVKAVLVTHALASDWPEWAARDSSGYSHEVEASIWEVERDSAGVLTSFEPLIASRSLVHVPWRPTETSDGGYYPYSGYAFEVTIPFVESAALPDEYVVLLSYNTESAGPNPLGVAGPYNSLNYGLNRSEVSSGTDPDPSSLVQVTPQAWNYSPSWGSLRSLITEVVSRSVAEMESIPSDQPARVGEYLTAFYEDGAYVEQATVRILPRPITLTASSQERDHGDTMVLDQTAFTVTDVDGDSTLPNGEVIDTVALSSANGVSTNITAELGTYVDEIEITSQSGSNGFSASNYDLSYVAGDLSVVARGPTFYTLNATGSSGEPLNGVDGWSQSEANYSADYPRAYVQPFSGDVTGFAVGGFYDTEPFTGGDSLTVSQSLGGRLANGATLNATFQMQDSSVLIDPDKNPTYFDVDRNQFSIGLGGLVSLVLQPAAQSSDPGNDTALWNPFISVGGELIPITGAQVQEGGSYTFRVSLSSSAGGLDYNASLTDLGGTSFLSSGSIAGSSVTDLLTTADVGWSLAGTEVDGLGSNSIAISAFSVRTSGGLEWESLQPRIYSGTAVDLLPDQPEDVVRYQLPATVETPVSFSNIPSELDLSYLSVAPGSGQVSAMGNLVEGDSGAASYVHAVNAVLVTHAPASDWPELAARDSSGYSHEVEASIWEVERDSAGVLTSFEPLIASRSLVHVPWRPTETSDGSPYPNSGYAFEVTIPFVESAVLPDEYVVLLSYNTESEGPAPLGVAGPYDSLNYGLSESEVLTGTDPDASSLVQVTPQAWNYSSSWGGLGSIMTEVVSRSVAEMESIPSDQPARVGEYLTAFYEDGAYVEQATVRILPRPITLTASSQERDYGDTLVLDETAFTVTDLDGDSTLPNGEVIDTVTLSSVTGVDVTTTANVGTYTDEIAITGQSGSNGFDADNYDLSYVAGELAVLAQGPTFYTLNATGSSGDSLIGVDGWSQSEANYSADYPRAYVQPFSGGVTGFAVGGFYDTEPFTGGDSLTVSQSLGGRLASGATLNATFQMQDSSVLIDPDKNPTYFDVDRNQFSIGLGGLVSLVLQPAAQSSDPGNDTALWNPFISVGGELIPITGAQVQEGGSYTFRVSLSSSAGGLDYNASLTDLGGTSFLSSGSIAGSSVTDLLTTADVGWSLAGTEVDGLGSNSIAISAFSVRTSGGLEWESLQPRIYSGTAVDLLPDQPEDVVRYQLPATVETSVSFSNIPTELDLSYLSVAPGSGQVSAMGNLVEGDSGAASYVHAVNAVLVTHAPASDWPELAARDSSGYSHEVEASIWEVERDSAGVLTSFEPLIASRSLVHVPWRPTETSDGSPYPNSGYAFEVTIPFVESAVLPDEYVVLLSYNTESEGPAPLGVAGPYDSLNYGLSESEVLTGTDPDASSLVQVTPQAWNYSSSWGGLGSIMTEVVSRSVAEMESIPSDQPARVGEYLTAFYEDGTYVEQATVRILPRPITLTASSQERDYGDTLVLDETAFTVTDLDGDSTLPNGEVIDTVTLNSVTGVDVTTTANVGTYTDEIAITGQSGSNGFDADNYDLSYVAGELSVLAQGPTFYTLNATGSSGDSLIGVDGWSQSEANYSADYPRAYVQPFSGDVTGFAVGGFYDTEPFTGGDSLTVSQSLGGRLASGATLNATFQMQDSSVLIDPDKNPTYFDVDRNQFSIGLGGLVSLVLQPAAQSSDPGNDTALWNPFISVGGELIPITGAQVQEGGSYTFRVSLSSSAGGLDYNASLTDLGGTSFLSSGSIAGSSVTDLLTTADVGWSLAGTEVDGLGSNSIAISAFSVRTSGGLEWESLQPRIYSGTAVDLLPDQPEDVVRYQLPATVETSVSFSNIPTELDLSYLSVAPGSGQVSAMGNLVEGDSGAASYVHAVNAVLVTHAPASDWPELAARDSSGYSHEVEASIWEVERDSAGVLTSFEPLIASRSLVHVPWRPTETSDGSPYPNSGYAFEVTIPFVESAVLPDEYVVLLSYNTESEGPAPLGVAGPYDSLNYGLSESEVLTGTDPDASSLVQVTPQAWNYSSSWGGLGSIMTEVVSRSVAEMESIPSDQPARVGEYLTAFYEDGTYVEQATVRILPRPITLTASSQERDYGDTLVLDETAFTVTDLDGDSTLPNGEVIDTVALSSAAGVNVGTYADGIEITGQSGSNGFDADNYDLSYVAGELVVNRRAVVLAALQQDRAYGDTLVLDETAFTVTDLDGDSTLPNGEVIDTVALNSVTGIDATTTANVGGYSDEIAITGQSGSNGFDAGNYNLSYLSADLVVNQRAVTLTASQQERPYGNTLILDETAFVLTDLDGDSSLPNGEVINTVALNSVTGVDFITTSDVGTYADAITITAQAGSNGFSVGNYDLSYVAGDLIVNPRPVTLTALPQERIYGEALVLNETAFTVTDLDGDSVLPNGELIDTVILNSATGVNVGTYADAIAITGQSGSNGFSPSNYDLSYVAGELVVNRRAVTLTASQQERAYGDTTVLDETAFTVTDLDGDNTLPNGEVIDTVTLNNVGVVNVGISADVIEITGQSGSNGFDAGNYNLSYVTGDLVVNPRAVILTASQQERAYGDTMVLDETAFTVTDLDGDSVLPNGEVIDTVALISATGVDVATTSDADTYADEIEITGQTGSNGFDADNYEVSYVAGNLVVNQRGLMLIASQQERTYGETMVLDETAFGVADLDGNVDSVLPNGEVIDTVVMVSVTGVDANTASNAGTYADEIEITGQSGSNGFDADNYDLSYVAGDLIVNPRAVTLTALPEERDYGDEMILDETAFTLGDPDDEADELIEPARDHDVLPNGEVIDRVFLRSITGVDVTTTANAGTYADEIEIIGQAGSNGFDENNYILTYVSGDLIVNRRAVTLTALPQERTYGDTLVLDETAFTVTDRDGGSALPNGEVIDTVEERSVTGANDTTTYNAGTYADEIEITGQAGSNGFDENNYILTYVSGDLIVNRRAVTLTALPQERAYGETLVFDVTAFTVADVDGDAVLPNGERIDTVTEISATGVAAATTAEVGTYADEIEITGQSGSNGFDADNYDITYVTGDLVVVGETYTAWIQSFLESGEIEPFDDPDLDGLTNLMEYALGGNPVSVGGRPPVEVSKDGVFSGQISAEQVATTVVFESSLDLQTWVEFTPSFEDNGPLRSWEWSGPEQTRSFVRLRVLINP